MTAELPDFLCYGCGDPVELARLEAGERHISVRGSTFQKLGSICVVWCGRAECEAVIQLADWAAIYRHWNYAPQVGRYIRFIQRKAILCPHTATEDGIKPVLPWEHKRWDATFKRDALGV